MKQTPSSKFQVPRPAGRAAGLRAVGRGSGGLGWFTAAFTLIELLVVIAIIGILAAIVGPSLGHFRKGDAMLAGTRQMLDGVARARQLAISQRTMVYMVFVPPGFWMDNSGKLNTAWFDSLTPPQRTAVTNLLDKQLTGFNFVTLRSIGDQPGQNTARYLSAWQTLPDKCFIALEKFAPPPNYQVGGTNVTGFSYINTIPFPTEDSPVSGNLNLPCIAFNYLGQTVTNGDTYIPLAHGSVSALVNGVTKVPVMVSGAEGYPTVLEQPPGNSVEAYNLVHIDWLTGRAQLERPQMQ